MLVVETGFAIRSAVLTRGDNDRTPRGEYFIPDADLGYKARPATTVTASKAKHGETIYRVRYTIDDKGRRLTPGDASGPTWVFMGCSYTFGEGVNDSETLPSYFSADMGNHENVLNLAFQGYGPHQMLRLLETEPRSMPAHADHVIYQAIFYHVRRSAGRAEWDLSGPRYRIDGDSVVYTGPFYGRRTRTAIQMLRQSDFLSFVSTALYFNERFDARDLELYGRIVEQSARAAKRRLGADFTILYWDDTTSLARQVLKRLTVTGLPLVRVSTIIPRSEWTSVRLPNDLHPGPEANRRIAAWLARSAQSPNKSR